MAKRRVTPGMRRVEIIRVYHMAGRAAARAIVPGMIVRAGQRENRIQQARLLQSKKYRIGAQLRPEPALAQLVVWLSWIFFGARIPEFRFFHAAAFKHAQYVARLRNFPAVQWL